MFCPNCGNQIKDNIKFCPVCGTAIGKKPSGDHKKGTGPLGTNQKLSVKLPTVKAISPLLAGKNLKRAMLPAAAVILVIILVSGVVFLTKPRLKNGKAKEIIAEYFQTHEDYNESENQYRECFQYVVNDLTKQLSEKLSSVLSGFVDISRINIDAMSGQIGSMLSDYFSDSSNQITLGEAMIAQSEYEVGKVVKKDGVVSVKVTVTSVDIGEVNRQLISDSVSAEGFANLAMKLVGGGIWGNVADIAGGDISFLLDGFVKKTKTVDKKNTCTGTIQFEYNKKTKEWEIIRADTKLLDAYFGID